MYFVHLFSPILPGIEVALFDFRGAPHDIFQTLYWQFHFPFWSVPRTSHSGVDYFHLCCVATIQKCEQLSSAALFYPWFLKPPVFNMQQVLKIDKSWKDAWDIAVCKSHKYWHLRCFRWPLHLPPCQRQIIALSRWSCFAILSCSLTHYLDSPKFIGTTCKLRWENLTHDFT